MKRPYSPLTLAISAFSLSVALLAAALLDDAPRSVPMLDSQNAVAGMATLLLGMLTMVGTAAWRRMDSQQRRALFVGTELERRREAKRRTPPPGSVG